MAQKSVRRAKREKRAAVHQQQVVEHTAPRLVRRPRMWHTTFFRGEDVAGIDMKALSDNEKEFEATLEAVDARLDATTSSDDDEPGDASAFCIKANTEK